MKPTKRNLYLAEEVGKSIAENLYKTFIVDGAGRGPGFKTEEFPGNLKNIVHAQANLFFGDRVWGRPALIDLVVDAYMFQGKCLISQGESK